MEANFIQGFYTVHINEHSTVYKTWVWSGYVVVCDTCAWAVIAESWINCTRQDGLNYNSLTCRCKAGMTGSVLLMRIRP